MWEYAAVSGGIALGNYALQNKQNKKSREFAAHMYRLQTEDARENWRMQNEYNTPEAQRERLEQAGLNPALMYGGQGAGGTPAGSPSMGKPLPGQFQASKIDYLGQMYNLKRQKIENDRAKSLADQEKIRADAMKELTSTDWSTYDPKTHTQTAHTGNLVRWGMKNGYLSGFYDQQEGMNDAAYSGERQRKDIEKIEKDIEYLQSNIDKHKFDKEYKTKLLEWQKQLAGLQGLIKLFTLGLLGK